MSDTEVKELRDQLNKMGLDLSAIHGEVTFISSNIVKINGSIKDLYESRNAHASKLAAIEATCQSTRNWCKAMWNRKSDNPGENVNLDRANERAFIIKLLAGVSALVAAISTGITLAVGSIT